MSINMKNLKPIIFIVIVLILTAITSYPQRKFNGRVIEVLDGKTCVIQLPGGRLTAVLQYVEVPEPEQPLAGKIKEHLSALIFDKQVEFMPRIVMKDRTVGRLVVKGVDISQQMLRDGAAWYSIAEKDGQTEDESLLYMDNEKQAKTEKLGVWGIDNLQPAWEYRAEQAELKRRKEREAYEKVKLAAAESRNQTKTTVQKLKVAPQMEMWADVGGANRFDQPLGVGDLRAGYDAAMKVGHISTPSIYLTFPSTDFLQKVDCRLFYIYKGDKTRIEDSAYILGFITNTKEYKFTKANNLTITADGQAFALGKARRFYRQDLNSVKELLLYKVTRAQLMKIAKAQKIGVQIGPYKGGLSNESLMYINNLLNAS